MYTVYSWLLYFYQLWPLRWLPDYCGFHSNSPFAVFFDWIPSNLPWVSASWLMDPVIHILSSSPHLLLPLPILSFCLALRGNGEGIPVLSTYQCLTCSRPQQIIKAFIWQGDVDRLLVSYWDAYRNNPVQEMFLCLSFL